MRNHNDYDCNEDSGFELESMDILSGYDAYDAMGIIEINPYIYLGSSGTEFNDVDDWR